ncbi:MAG: rhamnan synthesis F family protein [Pseudomonadota bacterium]
MQNYEPNRFGARPMVEWWKVRREFGRLGTQIVELRPFLMGPINRIYYDRMRRAEIVCTEGKQPGSSDLAVILIYQPEGLLKSTRSQLDHLLAHGVTPIVVSNADIGVEDRAFLEKKSLFILERPNFGYDFGGYRDAVLELLSRNLKFDNLFLLNDSIWFPIRENCTLLDTARRAPADVFGIFYSKKSKKKSHWHLHSYFYRFKGRLVQDAAFARYWKTMPLYEGSKRIVIRQFETKLTAYFVKNGFQAGGLYDAADVRRATHGLDDEQTLRAVDYYMANDHLTRSILRPVAESKEHAADWRAKVDDLIEHSKFGNHFLNAHPWVFLENLRSPILKKNRDAKFVGQRAEIIDLDLDKTLLPAVREEVRAWD